jgi:transcriptional regulator with XRE-family HTH domain
MRKPSPEQALRAVVAENVRVERQRRGWSQEQLAEKAGLHRNYIGAIERAEVNFGIENVAKLAVALVIPPHALLQQLKRE